MRLFVAVNLPAGERHAAWDATATLRTAGLPVRWVAADHLHVTLKFLGEVAAERATPIGEAIAGAVREARSFAVTLGGAGAFPSPDRPRVVWIGVEAHPALELLANDVERALAPFAFASELRPFHPHVTIGRVGREVRPSSLKRLRRLLDEVAYSGVMRVESVDLMESVTGRDGASYRVVHRAPLREGA